MCSTVLYTLYLHTVKSHLEPEDLVAGCIYYLVRADSINLFFHAHQKGPGAKKINKNVVWNLNKFLNI